MLQPEREILSSGTTDSLVNFPIRENLNVSLQTKGTYERIAPFIHRSPQFGAGWLQTLAACTHALPERSFVIWFGVKIRLLIKYLTHRWSLLQVSKLSKIPRCP